MSDEPFLKCPCQNCRDAIEFPAQGVGLTVECPHCGQRTLLTGPGSSGEMAPARAEIPPQRAVETAPTSEPEPARSKAPLLIAALLVAGALAGGASWYLKTKHGNQPGESVSPEVPSKPSLASATHEIPPKEPAVAPDTGMSEKSIDDLKSGAVTLEKAKSGSLVYAVGKVKNESDVQRYGVKVEIEFTDAGGRPAGKATDYTQVIEPRQEWRFRALVLDSKAASGKVISVKED